jgi:imidazolonepropionase
MLAHGTTTVEIKSGYGLDVPTELRMLEAATALGNLLPIDTVGTFLGAHVVPEEFADDREGYVRLVEEEMLPLLAPLARYCDVFCDRGAFTVAEARQVLEAGKRYGLKPKVHAEQLGATGAARLAAEVGAVSADHLDHIDTEGAAALAAAGTVATLLPAASFSMRAAQAPARLLWDAGVTVAIATDCNPGTAYVESMQFVVAIAALEMGLSPAEALWAATRGGALALEEPDKGWIGAGAVADLVVLDAPSSVHIPYRPGSNLVWKVIKDGVVVAGGDPVMRDTDMDSE